MPTNHKNARFVESQTRQQVKINVNTWQITILDPNTSETIRGMVLGATSFPPGKAKLKALLKEPTPRLPEEGECVIYKRVVNGTVTHTSHLSRRTPQKEI